MQRSDANPFFWQFRGRPVLLLGGSGDDNLFQWTGRKLTDHLDLLLSVGGNYLRNTMSDRGGFPEDVEDAKPFKRLEDGRYDLTRWNPQYWERLENFLRETSERDIVVQVTLWDPHDWIKERWKGHHWNPRNNVSYGPFEGTHEPTRDDHALFYTVPGLEDIPEVRVHQEKFVRKILEYTLPCDHVLHNVENESMAPPRWQDYWARFMREEADRQGEEIQVTSMVTGEDEAYERVISRTELYSYLDFSQLTVGYCREVYERARRLRSAVQKTGPRPVNYVKIYRLERGSPFRRFWAALFAGAAAARFHRDQDAWGTGLNGESQAHILSARKFADRADLFALAPPDRECLKNRSRAEIYLLSEPGKQHAVAFLKGGETDLDLPEASRDYRGRWLDAACSKWRGDVELRGGETAHIEAPGEGIWVLLLRKS